LMQLKFYLRAVANTILDYRMHCAKMTDADVMKLLVEGAFQSEGEARLKLIRAKQSSTQLSTYFVGRMAHYRLRQQMERELGDKFDLARYHEAVLEEGSIPVKYLPELVRGSHGENFVVPIGVAADEVAIALEPDDRSACVHRRVHARTRVGGREGRGARGQADSCRPSRAYEHC